MPIAAGLFSLLAGLSKALGNIDALDGLRTNQEGIAFYVDAATFLLSAFMISRLKLPKNKRQRDRAGGRIDFGAGLPRAEGGLVVRLHQPGGAGGQRRPGRRGSSAAGCSCRSGPLFSDQVLNAGTAGFGLFIFALGSGVAVGVRAALGLPTPHPQGAGVHGVAVRGRARR